MVLGGFIVVSKKVHKRERDREIVSTNRPPLAPLLTQLLCVALPSHLPPSPIGYDRPVSRSTPTTTNGQR